MLLFQLNELRGSPSWVGRLLALGWVALLLTIVSRVAIEPWLDLYARD